MALPDLLVPSPIRRHLRGSRPLVILVLVSTVMTVAICVAPGQVPMNLLVIPLLIGSLVLGPRPLPWFVIYLMVLLVVSVKFQYWPLNHVDAAGVVVDFLLGFIVLLIAFRRSRLGVAGLRGESMFVDLRDRILNQGGMPTLPPDWYAEKAISSAGGTLFAGDFVVASRSTLHRLEVALVDVSGKGEQAGTRALLLSGAFGGLIGAVEPDRFLPAANDYLLRQGWEEGFATAIHLLVDLASGAYEVRTAGHPPALRYAAGGDEWSTVPTEGPVLGLIEDPPYDADHGVLRPGDALVLYTDGMVEEPRRDIEVGTQRLIVAADGQLRTRVEGAAERLVARVGSKDDDRCVVIVSRRDV